MYQQHMCHINYGFDGSPNYIIMVCNPCTTKSNALNSLIQMSLILIGCDDSIFIMK